MKLDGMNTDRPLMVYKIRRVSDGLFSTGGLYPKFTRSGKAWPSIGALKCHLAQFTCDTSGAPRCYEGCEVVCYTITPREERRLGVAEFLVRGVA